MNDLVNGYIDSLISFCSAKIDALEKILMITNNQIETINDSDTDKLFEQIEAKQKEIDFIDKIDGQFENILSQLKKELRVNSLEEMDGKKYANIDFLKDCITRIFSLVKSIQQVEKQNNEQLNIIKNEIKQKIDTINSGKKVASSYNMTPVSSAMFFDTKK